MPSPRALLFDLDDTLYDHRRNARRAVEHLCRSQSALAARTLDEVDQVHREILEDVHALVLQGRLDLDGGRAERMRRLLHRFGDTVTLETAGAIAEEYRRTYVRGRQTVPGARELLEASHARFLVGVVTNNVYKEQVEKMAELGLAPFAHELVVSEEVGAWKPDPRIFEVALSRLGVQPGEAIMIGDSWKSDIEGARTVGIAAVWYNPRGELRPAGSEGNGTVPELRSLLPTGETLARILSAMGTGSGK